jgi:hypothetical protein
MECESRAFATEAKAELLHSLSQFDVGLLRMQSLIQDQYLNLRPMGESVIQVDSRRWFSGCRFKSGMTENFGLSKL